MATTQRLFSDPLPYALYIDADFTMRALVKSEKHHQECLEFAERLRQKGTPIFSSVLLIPECLNTWEKFGRKGATPLITAEQWENELYRIPFMDHGLNLIRGFLKQLNYHQVRILKAIEDDIASQMAYHNIRSYDALHLATMRYLGLPHIACTNSHFLRVDNLEVWNNQIYLK